MNDDTPILPLPTDDFWAFVRQHAHDDVYRLRLKCGTDKIRQFAVDQIEARRKTERKLSLWERNEKLLFPSVLSAEQASSEDTARYKQSLLAGRYDSVCDLTGGLGIDAYHFAQAAKEVVYIERFGHYCEVARHNFAQLGCNNISVVHADCREYLHAPHPHHDLYYADPARRGEGNKRVFGLADCEPDIAGLWPAIAADNASLWVKASPMLDISQTLRDYPAVQEVYVLAVKNECKELLFMLSPARNDTPVRVTCVNIVNDDRQIYTFFPAEEAAIPAPAAPTRLGGYLYEPGGAILKAGAYKSVARDFPVSKLSASSHLYTSDEFLADFPGRTFEIVEVIPFSRPTLKACAARYPQANLSCRNFPLSVEELRRQSKIKDGGDIYIFATIWNVDKLLIVCRKPSVC